MDSMTFTAHRLDQHRAAQLERENDIIRSQRERGSSAAPHPRTGVHGRLLRGFAHRTEHRVASAH